MATYLIAAYMLVQLILWIGGILFVLNRLSAASPRIVDPGPHHDEIFE
jgi:hypothetical protein